MTGLCYHGTSIHAFHKFTPLGNVCQRCLQVLGPDGFEVMDGWPEEPLSKEPEKPNPEKGLPLFEWNNLTSG